MPRRWLPDNVSAYTDRHGKTRFRFRKVGYRSHDFKAQPGTEAFREELAACLAVPGTKPIGAGRVVAGTFDELLGRYYRSPDYLNPGARTQVVYRGVLELWRERTTKSGRRFGAAMVRDLTAAHVEQMMADMLPHRTAANMLRKRLRAIMDYAVRQGDVAVNPVISTKPFAVDTLGFHTWTEDEIAAYEARHPIGSTGRLAFDLLLWTGQRSGDARAMGPQHVKGKRLVVTQEKTGAIVSLPIMPALAASILATPTRGLVFILNERGAPFTRKGFGNKMRQWCDKAGLPHCSAHGLRKAAARRFAEAGCSNQQIKAWTGHTTDSEIARYTAAASQEVLSDAAAEMLLLNLRNRVVEPAANDGKKG